MRTIEQESNSNSRRSNYPGEIVLGGHRERNVIASPVTRQPLKYNPLALSALLTQNTEEDQNQHRVIDSFSDLTMTKTIGGGQC